jgi:hypothetical protein
MRRGLRLALFLGALVIATAAFADGELFAIYQKYQKAIAQEDAAGAKFFLSNGRRAQLSGKSSDAALSEMDVLSPKENLKLYSEIVDGDDATLVVTADVEENKSTGRIQFVKEQGTWKILSEMWDLGGSPECEPTAEKVRQPENDAQRDALRKLREMGFPEPTASFLVMSGVEGNLEAVKLFIAAGYSPDTKDNGSPPIVSAAMFNHPEVVMYLISAGANVIATDDVNTTALMRIADKCDATAAIKALIKAGAKTDIKSAGGATAADLAGYSQCTDNVAAIKAASKKK